MTTVESRRYTPDDLLRMEDGSHYELVDGQLVERNVSFDSSRVAIRIALQVGPYVLSHGLGEVADSELGVRAFPAFPARIRRGDVLFIRSEHVPTSDTGYLHIAPDLVVEVVSPGDIAVAVRAKADEWLDAGVRTVWVVYPSVREVTVYRMGRRPVVLTTEDEIDGEEVIPGFRCPVASFFPEPVPSAPPPAQP